MTDTREATPRPAMEARERLAIRLGHADGYELRDIRSTVGPEKDASLWRKYLMPS